MDTAQKYNKGSKTDSVMSEKPKKTRTKRPLAERLKTISEDKLRERAKKAQDELKCIAAEAKRRMDKKVDLTDLTKLV